ncbi:exonuclease subunit SbcD [Candidatus Symbiopectobacterium sp. NZEC127]|uniref:exonuclease subunit SbcD n=1 Tax=Candidatus Symbiopectobacterium sp. NZEC127 TaxID=2820472 RepID=UPI0022261953|nr:exonuclease subunit SbcD [Candidatus Symbiopectobacterium sp. NZEC127]MCW2487467.1 exonuclease subunit SbcD [Candidatus Symbiopectobacterium sp. NZEC127]
MRIIHTADWHLGQYFYTKSRAPEHQAFLDWLIEQITEHQVDALIVAGDIFDNGSPPSYAREMLNRFVVALRPTGCQLVLLAGNHDAVATLNESRDLLACLNTRVIANAAEDVTQQVLALNTRQGAPGAMLCAIPFLRPRDILRSLAGQSGEEKQLALQDAISGHYAQCYQYACDLRDTLALPLPIIATGHLTTVGVTASEAVREIYIGSLDAYPVQAFPPADYIALGHIHRPQRVGHSEHIRYSGSPIALSFDELGSEKSVALIDFPPSAPPEITLLPVPVTQPMRLIKGNLTEIEQQLHSLPAPETGQRIWLDIEIATDTYLSDMQQRIQQLTHTLPVDVLLLRRNREQRLQAIAREKKETLDELSPQDVFERKLALTDMAQEQQARLRPLFDEMVRDVTEGAPQA